MKQDKNTQNQQAENDNAKESITYMNTNNTGKMVESILVEALFKKIDVRKDQYIQKQQAKNGQAKEIGEYENISCDKKEKSKNGNDNFLKKRLRDQTEKIMKKGESMVIEAYSSEGNDDSDEDPHFEIRPKKKKEKIN